MNRNEDKQTVRRFLDQSFRRVRELPAAHVDSACGAVLTRLRAEPEGGTFESNVVFVQSSRRRFRPALAFAAIAAAISIVAFLRVAQPEAIAVVESAEGGLYRTAEEQP